MAGPFATWQEAHAVAEQFRAQEKAQQGAVSWRRRFAVCDIRDCLEARELLGHDASELAAWLPHDQRQPHRSTEP